MRSMDGRRSWAEDNGPERILALHQSGAERETSELRYRSKLQLSHQALSMGLYRPMADAELARDLLVGTTLGDPKQHLALSTSELIESMLG